MTVPPTLNLGEFKSLRELGKGDSQPIFPNCTGNELSAWVMQSDGSKSLD
jgi:hypothetical protein